MKLVFLMYLEGYSYKEIGEKMGKCSNSVGTIIHRVKKYLQGKLDR